MPDESFGDWYVLHTKSRQEKVLADLLRAMGIAHYLPLVEVVRVYASRKVTVSLPVFPGFVFMRGSREDAFRADRTNRVASIVDVQDQDQLDWELRNLHLALTRNATLKECGFLKKGSRVQVRTGPLRGLQGIVLDPKNPDQLVLQVQAVGRAVCLKIDSPVEPIE